jgi:hypothetical protein
VLSLKPIEPPLVPDRQLRFRRLGHGQEIGGVTALDLIRFPGLLEFGHGELSDRLQHREPEVIGFSLSPDQALVHQGAQHVQHVDPQPPVQVGHGLGGLDRPTPDERRQTGE